MSTFTGVTVVGSVLLTKADELISSSMLSPLVTILKISISLANNTKNALMKPLIKLLNENIFDLIKNVNIFFFILRGKILGAKKKIINLCNFRIIEVYQALNDFKDKINKYDPDKGSTNFDYSRFEKDFKDNIKKIIEEINMALNRFNSILIEISKDPNNESFLYQLYESEEYKNMNSEPNIILDEKKQVSFINEFNNIITKIEDFKKEINELTCFKIELDELQKQNELLNCKPITGISGFMECEKTPVITVDTPVATPLDTQMDTQVAIPVIAEQIKAPESQKKPTKSSMLNLLKFRKNGGRKSKKTKKNKKSNRKTKRKSNYYYKK